MIVVMMQNIKLIKHGKVLAHFRKLALWGTSWSVASYFLACPIKVDFAFNTGVGLMKYESERRFLKPSYSWKQL